MTSDEIIGFKKSSKINGLKLDETCRTPNSYFKSRVLIFLWRICERYEPCTFTWKSHLSSLLDKDGSFMEMYRATALQRGKSFPSCAWRMPLLHRAFSLAFARRFLDLTTFLRQIFGKIVILDLYRSNNVFAVGFLELSETAWWIPRFFFAKK